MQLARESEFFFIKYPNLKKKFFFLGGGGNRWTDSQTDDHFDLYLTPVTLTFNLPEKMFQMELLLLEGNNCAK